MCSIKHGTVVDCPSSRRTHSRVALVVFTLYRLLRFLHFVGWSSRSVSTLTFVGCATSGTRHSRVFGHHHPVRTAAFDNCDLCGLGIVVIYFLLVVDGDVISFHTFAGAEEGIFHLRHYVYTTCWFSKLVVQLVNCCCHCDVAKSPTKTCV